MGTAVVPISWGQHAASAFGATPQQILNGQIVDGCDICLAIFANRLGTPTDTAESGTAEEVRRLHEAGKYVAILRCRRQVDPQLLDFQQAAGLEEYLRGLGQQALILEYDSDTVLQERVDAILTFAVAHDAGRAEVQMEATSAPINVEPVAEVWPRVETTEKIRTDSRGQIKSQRNHYLVLTNTGGAPARDVSFEIDAPNGEDPHWIRDHEPLEVLAPHNGEARYPLLLTFGSAAQVRCRVRWTDSRGLQENVAALRY